MVPLCRRHHLFGKPSNIPVALKLLCTLRMLGRGTDADTIAEISGIGESTINTIFKTFCRKFVNLCYHQFVALPDDEDMKLISETYGKLGLPGALGSMDCTHVQWLKCPIRYTSKCKGGKDKYPTLSFLMIVDHSRRIQYISNSFWAILMMSLYAKQTHIVYQSCMDYILTGSTQYLHLMEV